MDLFGTVIAALERILLRTLDLICRIGGDQVDLDRILQCLVDVCMVMDHRICLDPFKLFGIEILQIGGFQVYQLDAALAEIGSDDALHHSLITGIGRDLDRAFRDFQPFQHEVRKENVIVQADLRRCGGNHEVPPTFQQKSFGFLLVPLDGQTGGFPLGLSLSVCVLVTQNDVVEVVFFLQMPCYHNVSSCLCIHLNM